MKAFLLVALSLGLILSGPLGFAALAADAVPASGEKVEASTSDTPAAATTNTPASSDAPVSEPAAVPAVTPGTAPATTPGALANMAQLAKMATGGNIVP